MPERDEWIIGGDGRGGTSTSAARAEGGRRRQWSLIATLVLTACTSTVGTLPRVAALAPSEGHKMLRPALAVTECRTGLPWAANDADLLDAAFRRLLARDDEANLVLNARIESTWWSVGVYGERCVTLTGDLVRTTTTILLPMPASHGDHGGH